MKKFNNISAIHGGETRGAISGAAFGISVLWLLMCEKKTGKYPTAGSNIEHAVTNNIFFVIGSLVTYALVPMLADHFNAIDNNVIEFFQYLCASANKETE
jgi:hypothetical protein